MQYKFVLVSRRNDDALRIREELERNRLYTVELIETAASALARLRQPDVNAMVLNLETFNLSKMKLITDLRDLGIKFPIMVTATHLQDMALAAMQNIAQAVLIEKPFEAKDLWGIAQKMVQGTPVAQRIHRRFYTNQTAKMEKITNGQLYTGRVYNLSKGGAYLEVDSGRLSAGDLIKLSVQLARVSKNYNVDAEVVWAAPKGVWKGRPAAGVRFVKSEDIYRNLLTRL